MEEVRRHPQEELQSEGPFWDLLISVRGGGAAAPPVGKKKYYSGKTDVPLGQRHSKKYFVF